MRRVVTNICNSLMGLSISDTLRKTGLYVVQAVESGRMLMECTQADILLLEVAYNSGYTIDERLNEIPGLRRAAPACKVLLICDENSAPELAWRVALSKRDGLIDDFIYSSVSESYLTAMLDAM